MIKLKIIATAQLAGIPETRYTIRVSSGAHYSIFAASEKQALKDVWSILDKYNHYSLLKAEDDGMLGTVAKKQEMDVLELTKKFIGG